MLTHNLGYPRIGSHRQLKRACENYWAGKTTLQQLLIEGHLIRKENWLLQQQQGLDLIPSNDFSFYDQVLDMSLMVNAIPERFHEVILQGKKTEYDLYFAMARGYQQDGLDIIAMEMTKWFDTNYHYLVPEFRKDQPFKLFSTKVLDEFKEAKRLGVHTKPVLIGPVSYLLLGKEKEEGFDRIDLLDNLLPVYVEIFRQLEELGATWIQLDEPFLAMELSIKEKAALLKTYPLLKKRFPKLKILLASYFGGIQDHLDILTDLPVDAIHLDLVRAQEQLEEILPLVGKRILSLGVVDGRNIWINDIQKSLNLIQKAAKTLPESQLWIAPSCSLLHVPCNLELETDEATLQPEIKQWMAFAKQKLEELGQLKSLAENPLGPKDNLTANQVLIEKRNNSALIHDPEVAKKIKAIRPEMGQRQNPYTIRQSIQRESLNLPLFPTTTIGSFPQTQEIRLLRSQFKKGQLSQPEYDQKISEEIASLIHWQEEIGLDVLVHGEFERNDMVEFFGEKLQGYAFSKNGWVQSYGSRCVKPPIIYGDISRPKPMTVDWASYAQSLSKLPVKGMLTGPVTILQWSFVRDDQPRYTTAFQIALAIREEVLDLEKAGISIIQIDEPAIREGLPLKKEAWADYLIWAIEAFRISASGVRDETQIHTHMCYSEFNDILPDISAMDADVITIECSRSQMELLDAFRDFQYPNAIGPGVYDIHSPRVPNRQEMKHLLEKASALIPIEQLWVNPDCGLKTRHWPETQRALIEMVSAAREIRESLLVD